ncbi:hypothetical protein PHLGIDRAFT_409544 [Phlebiopsis gigantea 11061_1 CR5-6]|uniref:Uncharacterized protein n=1 Tax=Phlebiopsis gigantea (strain 11061_1 CR5-6) TaxID=745531 RepID=A0A0C3NR64_PHLG1|nr:hypothetical protein PHLGIDRAFT_409544 [Phlebiopsis gigantea 11061_1 CR5-6]
MAFAASGRGEHMRPWAAASRMSSTQLALRSDTVFRRLRQGTHSPTAEHPTTRLVGLGTSLSTTGMDSQDIWALIMRHSAAHGRSSATDAHGERSAPLTHGSARTPRTARARPPTCRRAARRCAPTAAGRRRAPTAGARRAGGPRR